MRGIMFAQLRDYVNEKIHGSFWEDCLEAVNIPHTKRYFSNKTYPDDEFFRIFFQILKESGKGHKEFLEEFGAAVGPTFFEMFKMIINPAWKTLDLLEHLEDFNYNMLQKGEEEFNMGKFVAERPAPDLLLMTYTSPRQLCHFFIGLVKAISKHYGETVDIVKKECVLKGANCCKFEIRLAPQTKLGQAKRSLPNLPNASTSSLLSSLSKAPDEASHRT